MGMVASYFAIINKFAIGSPFSFAVVLNLSEDLLDASFAYGFVVFKVLLNIIHEVLETKVARTLCVFVDGLGNLVLHLGRHIVIDGLLHVLRHIVTTICALMIRWSSYSRIHSRLFTKSIWWSGRLWVSSLRIIHVSVVGTSGLIWTLFLASSTRSWRCANFMVHLSIFRIMALICTFENIQIWTLLFLCWLFGHSLWRVLYFELGLSWRGIVCSVNDFFRHSIRFVAWWSSCIAHSSIFLKY